MAAASARQAAARMDARVARAEVHGISDAQMERRVEKLVAAHERASERQQEVVAARGGPAAGEGQPQPLGPARPSRADEITASRVDSMSWDEVADLSSELSDDPDAWDKLETLVNERESRETGQFNDLGGFIPSGDAVTNPAVRPNRKLTQRERVREEYDSYVASQYFQAEEELGFMVNREGRAKGIDPYTLFSGPSSRVKRYGSEELQAWFGRNGRQTLSSFRHQMLGWESDRKARSNAGIESYDHVANV